MINLPPGVIWVKQFYLILIVEEIIAKHIIEEKDFQKYDYKLEKMHLCLNSSKKELDESEQNKVSVSFYETSSKLK